MNTASEAAGVSSRGGWLPFRVAIVIVVVGLLVVTCGSLIAYVLYRGTRASNCSSAFTWNRSRIPRSGRSYVCRDRGAGAARPALPPRARLLRDYRRGGPGTSPGRRPPGGPGHTWVSYSEEATGRFMGANRIRGDEVVLNLSDPGQHRGVPHELRIDTLEPYVRTPPLTAPYEPRTREWYQRTVVAPPGTIVWMPPYAFAEGVKGITAAVAARDRAQNVLGVFTVDFALTGVANFLQTIASGAAAPWCCSTTTASLSPVLRAQGDAATSAVGHGRARAASPTQGAPDGDHGPGGAVGGRARPITHGTGFAWTVAVAVPDEAFMGPVYANDAPPS